jgi:hypothetical protein
MRCTQASTLVSILSLMNSAQCLPVYFLNMCFNIILQPVSRFSKLSFKFSDTFYMLNYVINVIFNKIKIYAEGNYEKFSELVGFWTLSFIKNF